VTNAYGFSSVHQARFVTAELDRVPKKDLIEEVSLVFNKIKPDTIYLPHRDDVHSDHEAVFDAVAACIKSFRYPFIRRVLACETLSETEFGVRPGVSGFNPNLWVDVTDYIDKKIEIMKVYEGEVGEHPFPRSERNIRALATVRGARAGQQSSEAFMVLQEFK
jgi:LmbE family N-acetylglucosaminyl deacetylase